MIGIGKRRRAAGLDQLGRPNDGVDVAPGAQLFQGKHLPTHLPAPPGVGIAVVRGIADGLARVGLDSRRGGVQIPVQDHTGAAHEPERRHQQVVVQSQSLDLFGFDGLPKEDAVGQFDVPAADRASGTRELQPLDGHIPALGQTQAALDDDRLDAAPPNAYVARGQGQVARVSPGRDVEGVARLQPGDGARRRLPRGRQGKAVEVIVSAGLDMVDVGLVRVRPAGGLALAGLAERGGRLEAEVEIHRIGEVGVVELVKLLMLAGQNDRVGTIAPVDVAAPDDAVLKVAEVAVPQRDAPFGQDRLVVLRQPASLGPEVGAGIAPCQDVGHEADGVARPPAVEPRPVGLVQEGLAIADRLTAGIVGDDAVEPVGERAAVFHQVALPLAGLVRAPADPAVDRDAAAIEERRAAADRALLRLMQHEAAGRQEETFFPDGRPVPGRRQPIEHDPPALEHIDAVVAEDTDRIPVASGGLKVRSGEVELSGLRVVPIPGGTELQRARVGRRRQVRQGVDLVNR